MRFKKHLLVFGLLSVFFLVTSAQEQNDYGFAPWTIPTVSVQGLFLPDPWAGGLNNAQFGKLDINNDGISDLLVFDRHGDRLLPFLYNANGSATGFVYSPEYRHYFPTITQWFQLADYNNDGFPDIFTYTPGGILVYRNKGESFPAFEKAVYPYIKSLQGNIFTNLLVTYVDYPAIADLDNDGDLDILTFWGLGSFIEHHQNMSMEMYGNADSLIFHKVNNCWGRFAEDDESNILTFDTCVDFAKINPQSPPKHTGSTFLLSDIDGNGNPDLMLGDVDYPDVVAILNSGNGSEAVMVEQLPEWPQNDPVYLWSFPLVQEIDLYNTGEKQLLVSPFDPSLVKSEGIESVWLYNNCNSGAGLSDCSLISKSFLQDGMIDLGLGALPVFADINGDGLTDLVVGNYGLYDTCVINIYGQLKCYYTGRLHLYLNNGTSSLPSFELADEDFGQLSRQNLTGVYPAFTDLDADGDQDMITGNSEGDFLMFENSAGQGNVPVFSNPVLAYQGLSVSGFSTPAFVEVNGDGLIDLVSGSVNGKLSYFENTGTALQPSFSLITDSFGGVNVTDPVVSYTGHSVPCFCKTAGGQLRLFAGSESGLIKYYKNITGILNQDFELSDPHFMFISEGIRTAPAMADLNNDGFPELAIGNYSGGITLFRGTTPGPAGVENFRPKVESLIVTPNPSAGIISVKINRPGNWQLNIYTLEGQLIKSIPVQASGENEVHIAESYSGILITEARNLQYPWLVLRSKIVIIR